MSARMYQVEYRRESIQIVEFSAEQIERGDPVLTTAHEMIDSADWWSDRQAEVVVVKVSDDDGKTWTALPMTEVFRMQREAAS